jgi:hypothetical protein
MDVDQLMGKWHVVASTLSLWQSGVKLDPTITYERRTATSWHDVVEYQTTGTFSAKLRPASVKGSDTLLGDSGLAFRWRGAGLLSLIKCDCKVRESDRGRGGGLDAV